jgi:hypothetical protein
MKKVDLFLDVMFWSVSQTHIWHLQTLDSALHELLKSYYEEMTEDLDEFAEGYIGETDSLLKTSKVIETKDLTGVSDVKNHFDEIYDYLKDVKDELEDEDINYKEIEDMLQDIAQFKYKLRMCDGYKGGEKKKKDDDEDDEDEDDDNDNNKKPNTEKEVKGKIKSNVKEIEELLKPTETKQGEESKENKKDDFLKKLLSYAR